MTWGFPGTLMDSVHDKVYLDSWSVTQLELFDILFLISFLKSLRNPIISLFVHGFPTFYTNYKHTQNNNNNNNNI